MANTLTAIAPVVYSAGREVPRETTGLIAACATNFADKGVAKGDSVKVTVAPVQAAADITPAQTFTAGSNRTPTTIDFTLNQYKGTSWQMTAEEERSLQNSDTAKDLFKQTLVQGMRVLINTMETRIGTVARAAASRAAGTAGTTPFASTHNLINNLGQILTDNGAGLTDRQLVINTAAGLNLRNIAQLQKVNEAGDAGILLRRGILGDLGGFALRESAGIASAVTAGTGASYVADGAQAVGATSILLKTGSGTVLAGDVVTFAGDTNKYVVKTGVAAPGSIVLQEPGLKQTLADGVAMTVGAAATANLAFCRNAVVLVARPALQPEGMIAEQMTFSDPQTGLSFLLMRSVGDGMSSWYLRIVYDVFCPNPYALGQLLG